MDSLLIGQGQPRQDAFFKRVEVVSKPAQAVLAVFFGKKDACVVDRSAFQVMAELNPQIRRSLETLAASEALANSVLCVSRDGWPLPEDRKNLLESLAELHLESTGQQILTLFKADQLVPFRQEVLANVRKLRDDLAGSAPP